MGKKQKEWGFVRHVKHKGYRWIDHKTYLGENNV
jgi:hypothetical protein